MNNVTLIGRLTKDAEERQVRTAGGEQLTVSTFTLAVNRNVRETDFIRCTAFGRIAELICDCCHKGSKIGITGRIQTGSYKNREDQTVYTTDVIVSGLDFCEKKADNTVTDNTKADQEPDPTERASAEPSEEKPKYRGYRR